MIANLFLYIGGITMPRLARKDLKTPFLHVMIQGVNKEYIFYKEKYIEKYIEIFNRNKEDYSFDVIAYCMMNNHAHFLIYTKDINKFGKFMHKTNLNYAQMYNKNEKRTGVLFRNRYQIEPIYNMEHLVNCIKYIHDNPVKAKMVSKCEDYKYSSFNDYINNNGIAQSKIIKELFGEKCDFRSLFKKAYDRRFIDTEETKISAAEYINNGIIKFEKEKSMNIIEILSNRKAFIELIQFLKDKSGLKYKEIREYLGISRGTMDGLKSKI